MKAIRRILSSLSIASVLIPLLAPGSVTVSAYVPLGLNKGVPGLVYSYVQRAERLRAMHGYAKENHEQWKNFARVGALIPGVTS